MQKDSVFEEMKVSVPVKFATLWASLMFIIIYLDYFHLYMPNSLQDMLNGRVFVFDISQGFLIAAMFMVAPPAMMIFLSVALPAKLNRLANIIVASINIPLLLSNLAGEAWPHMVIGAVLQMIILGLILRYAWNWPRISA
ncbi:MAG: hypothetical protein EP332_09675 [Bacteroidetes bacterium]|nr:MAG: hypothetical protein EP332_09675 [Bacteroidota bacterium]